MGDKVTMYLLCEIMGRYSNIILTKEDFTIIDAIKRVHFDVSDTPVLPNLKYSKPPQKKISLDDDKSLQELFENENQVDVSFIINNISGISKDTAKEIIQRKENGYYETIKSFFNIYHTDLYKPCLRYDKDNFVKDFYITPYLSAKGKYVHFDSINTCLDKFYQEFDLEVRKKTDTKQLVKLLKRLKNKLEKRKSDYSEKIEESKKAKTYKQWGELILANLYRIKKGDTLLKCLNFYDNTEVEIPLDEKLFPNQNAQVYFKKYRKLKKAKEIAIQQLKIIEKQKQYLKSIETALQTSSSKQEFKEIQDELLILGNLKKPEKSQKRLKEQPSKPMHINIEGVDVYVGKNNLQNDKVTFEIGMSNDTWLHAKGYHGSHTIIRHSFPPESILTRAAEICAYYSEAKGDAKVEIDYTLRKNVKRQKGGMPGMVDYKNYKTIVVTPKDITR